MLKVEWINPFLSALFEVGKKWGFEVEKQGISLRTSPMAGNEVNVAIGVTGGIRGQIILGTSHAGAMVLAKTIIPWGVTEFDNMARSSIQELTNVVSGTASSNFFETGVRTNLSPPTMFLGKEVEISSSGIMTVVISVKFTSPHGTAMVDLAVMLQESPAA